MTAQEKREKIIAIDAKYAQTLKTSSCRSSVRGGVWF